MSSVTWFLVCFAFVRRSLGVPPIAKKRPSFKEKVSLCCSLASVQRQDVQRLPRADALLDLSRHCTLDERARHRWIGGRGDSDGFASLKKTRPALHM